MGLSMFIATHGVLFGDPHEPWAHFKRNEALDTPEGEKRFTFSTEDPAIVKRLRSVKDYGITEVK